MPGLVVLGVGNVLLGDDGVGVHAAGALRAGGGLPAGSTVLDGGTGGLSLLPLIRAAAALVLIDAVDVGAGPGSVHVLTGQDLYASLVRLSVHQVGAADLLAAARLVGGLPARVVMVGVQPATLAPGVSLSPAVAAALPVVLTTVRRWCRRLTAPQTVG